MSKLITITSVNVLLYLLAGANIKLICNLARKKLTIFKVYFEIKIIETKLEKYLKQPQWTQLTNTRFR